MTSLNPCGKRENETDGTCSERDEQNVDLMNPVNFQRKRNWALFLKMLLQCSLCSVELISLN